MRELEILAPARDKNIGIAAIDCGADAVYIAGPSFGARKDAGNSIEDIAELCDYAHKFGVRVFMTVNTILFDDELEPARQMMLRAQDAGVDAFIVQDQAIWGFEGLRVPLHASTQCAIRIPETAKYYESLGSGRIVLERQLSLEDIRAIRDAVECELEFFVHGALCVCYSGNCYLSERIDGRSANRGACIQACRSMYDLVDQDGKVLVKNKALLSLKDYKLKSRLEDLADAGITSFKIEGRLKNISYVKNVVREYSLALDALVAAHPDKYCRSSYGRVSQGFTPDSEKTFNRGYTELFIDGKRGQWSSMDAPKSTGEFIGTVQGIRKVDNYNIEVSLKLAGSNVNLRNGDGFAIPGAGGLAGFRGDICRGSSIVCKSIPQIRKGARVYRNFGVAFEKELDSQVCRREIAVSLSLSISGSFDMDFKAVTEDGREIVAPFKTDLDVAENRERAEAMLHEQLSKRSGHYNFTLDSMEVSTAHGNLPLVSASTLNSIRRLIASDLDAVPVKSRPMLPGRRDESVSFPDAEALCKWNIANRQAAESVTSRGGAVKEKAYELEHRVGAEMMRTKYCIRYELGMCPVHQGAKAPEKLFLVNNGKKLSLQFDCRNCEMTVV